MTDPFLALYCNKTAGQCLSHVGTEGDDIYRVFENVHDERATLASWSRCEGKSGSSNLSDPLERFANIARSASTRRPQCFGRQMIFGLSELSEAIISRGPVPRRFASWRRLSATGARNVIKRVVAQLGYWLGEAVWGRGLPLSVARRAPHA